MDRKSLRELKALPIREFEAAVNSAFDKELQRTRSHSYYLAWSCMMLALKDRFPGVMSAEMLHSIAVDTIEYINGIEPATELGQRLYDRTGFDITEKPSMSDLEYIKKGARTWIDEMYLDIKARWNRQRVKPDNSDECRFLVKLLETIEKNTEEGENDENQT